MLEYRYDSYILSPDHSYLPPSIICWLLFILCFLVRAHTKDYTQKYHSFPALGFTAFVGGITFILFDLIQIKAGATLIISAGLAVLLIVLWVGARRINPPPVKGAKKIKPHNRFQEGDGVKPSTLTPSIALDDIELYCPGEKEVKEQKPR